MPGGGFGWPGGRRRAPAPARSSTFQELTDKDVKALQDKKLAPSIKSVSPIVNAQVTATYDGATHDVGQFFGSTPIRRRGAQLRGRERPLLHRGRGHRPRARDRDRPDRRAANLFGGQDPLDQTIKLNGASYRIIGVLESKGTNGIQDQDDVAIAPITAVRDTARRRQLDLPDRRPGDGLEHRRLRAERDRDRRSQARTRAPARAEQRLRAASASSTRHRCCRRRTTRTTRSPSCSARSPRSRCSSAGSAS